MHHTDDKDDPVFHVQFKTFMENQLEWHRSTAFRVAREGSPAVTVLAYFFREASDVQPHFDYLECAIRETWRHCGMLRTVLAVNERFPCIEKFAEAFSPYVEIQVEKSLVPGNIDSLSADCIGKMHQRFSTPYVMTIQDDGFPVRPGLEEFIGKADFIAAPRFSVRNLWYVRLMRRLLRECPFNGGFSLRSAKICRLAARHWERGWKDKPFSFDMIDDVFYTSTLPRTSLSYRLRVNACDVGLGYRFSIEGDYPVDTKRPPFGFHSPQAFCRLNAIGAVQALSGCSDL